MWLRARTTQHHKATTLLDYKEGLDFRMKLMNWEEVQLKNSSNIVHKVGLSKILHQGDLVMRVHTKTLKVVQSKGFLQGLLTKTEVIHLSLI